MSIEKGKIASSQLIFLITAFVQGSVLLISFIEGLAEHDTWIVVLSGMVISIPFILSYAALAKRFPGMNLIQINDIVYGRYLGKAISVYYIFFFLMTLSFNIRDIGDFYIIFLMPDTPMIFFLIVFAAICAYAVWKGIEVLARVSHLFVTTTLIVIMSTFLLLLGNMKFSNFLPVFEIPLIKFIHGTHIISAIPFAELVVFLIIMASLNDTKHIVKNTFIGLILGGLSLIFIAIRNTAVLGRTETILTSPSFQAARIIDIGNVFTRMDLLIGIGQTIMLFLKCSLFYYALVVSLSQLLRLKSYVPLILPLAGIEVVIAATVYQSTIDHVRISVDAGIVYLIPLVYIFPPLSLLISRIRGLPKSERRKKS